MQLLLRDQDGYVFWRGVRNYARLREMSDEELNKFASSWSPLKRPVL